MRLRSLLLVLSLAAFGCHSADDAGPSSSNLTCPVSAKEFCASQPEHCPDSKRTVCEWLLRDGRDSARYSGPIVCADGGLAGPLVTTDAGTRTYLFDEAGIAMILGGDDKGPICLGGTSIDLSDCANLIVAFTCVRSDAAVDGADAD